MLFFFFNLHLFILLIYFTFSPIHIIYSIHRHSDIPFIDLTLEILRFDPNIEKKNGTQTNTGKKTSLNRK